MDATRQPIKYIYVCIMYGISELVSVSVSVSGEGDGDSRGRNDGRVASSRSTVDAMTDASEAHAPPPGRRFGRRRLHIRRSARRRVKA